MTDYKASRTADMDKIFLIKELYAAVDHLEENILGETNPEKEKQLKHMAEQLTELRRYVSGSFAGDKNYACLFKHLAGAAKSAEEIWLATHNESDYTLFKAVNYAFLETANNYLGYKLAKCDRCTNEVNPTEEKGTYVQTSKDA